MTPLKIRRRRPERDAGRAQAKAFASEVLANIKDLPISFEVFSDDFDDIEGRTRLIDSWRPNVYVRIPVTETKGVFAGEVIRSPVFAGWVEVRPLTRLLEGRGGDDQRGGHAVGA